MKTERKVVFLAVLSALLSLTYLPRLADPFLLKEVPNPDHLIIATPYGLGLFCLDPVWAVYSTWIELISKIYETLVFFDRESADTFVPRLATEWTISPDGKTYTFKIRGTDGTEPPVKFHNGELLTTEDVEYSFERALVHDTGMSWVLYEPLLNVWRANLSDPEFGQKIDNAVERNATHVWFILATPYPSALEKVFFQILSGWYSSVLCKSWCIQQGDWPGTWENWQNYHTPQVTPLSDVTCGTGSYELDYRIENEWSILKFDHYWGGWPANGSRGFLTRVTTKYIAEWNARRDGFLAGDYDTIFVSTNERNNISQLWQQPGIRCVYPLPELSCSAIFYTFDISTASPYMGVPGGLPRGTLAENGISSDFFSDINVRKGFAYAFNYTQYIEKVWLGEAKQPATPVIEGLPYRNPEQEKYSLDLVKAEEYFQRAWGGELWKTGFTFTLAYTEGPYGYVASEILKSNVESLNPKFHIELTSVDFDTVLWPQMIASELPLFLVGWLADFADPHDFVMPFMYSKGGYSFMQRYNNSHVDQLIDQGVRTTNSTIRQEIYYELQTIYYNDCASVPVAQPVGRHWERDWVQGWYYNPLIYGLYCYSLWKESLPAEDINMNGEVDIFDVVATVTAFGSYYAVGDVHSSWNSRADFNLDQVVDIFDIVTIAKKFGFAAPPWSPPS